MILVLFTVPFDYFLFLRYLVLAEHHFSPDILVPFPDSSNLPKVIITLSKVTQNLKIRAYSMQNFMKLDRKKISDPKTLTFGVWDLKTSLGQFGPKAFGKGLSKPLVKNSGSNYQKQDLIFSRIMRSIQLNHKISKNVLSLRFGP